MKTIVSHIPYIPLRKDPAHKSEQVSQLLFGETAEQVDMRGEWILIKTAFDDYQGWIEKESVIEVKPEFISAKKLIVSAPFIRASNKNQFVQIPAGAEIPMPDSEGCFYLGDKDWHIENYNVEDIKGSGDSIADTALKFLNAPYLWGGRTFFGIDCSGFTQLVYKINQFTLPRDAKDQAYVGHPLQSLQDALPGDLVFFNNQEGAITHTGILLNTHEIIHASKQVRIDRVDEKGIFNDEHRKYTHLFNCIRQYK